MSYLWSTNKCCNVLIRELTLKYAEIAKRAINWKKYQKNVRQFEFSRDECLSAKIQIVPPKFYDKCIWLLYLKWEIGYYVVNNVSLVNKRLFNNCLWRSFMRFYFVYFCAYWLISFAYLCSVIDSFSFIYGIFQYYILYVAFSEVPFSSGFKSQLFGFAFERSNSHAAFLCLILAIFHNRVILHILEPYGQRYGFLK